MYSSNLPNCRFYGSMIGCRNANQCRYNHSNPNSVPFCQFYNNCRYGQQCKYRHVDHDSVNSLSIGANNIEITNNYPLHLKLYQSGQLYQSSSNPWNPNIPDQNAIPYPPLSVIPVNSNMLPQIPLPIQSSVTSVNSNMWQNQTRNIEPTTVSLESSNINAHLPIPPISERGLQIGTECEVWCGDKWWKGQIKKIYTKLNTDLVWVAIVCYADGVYVDYHEWSGYIMVKHNNRNTDERDIDYSEAINGCNGIINECIPTKRIINGLKYYQEDKEKFIKFINDQYPQLLNDWTHFISKHNDSYELEKVFDEMIIKKYELKPCDINNCPITIRHFRDRHKDAGINDSNKDQNEEYELEYYKDLMDGIHCYLYHLWDYGLRIRQSIKLTMNNFIDVQKFIKSKDAEIAKVKELLNRRYRTNNKFDLYAESAANSKGILFCFPLF